MSLRLLTPAGISVSERSAGEDEVNLHPAERALVAGSPAARRRSFATARACAHDALARLGAQPGPLLAGAGGEPLWPAGFTGSLTHTRDYHAAAVARSADARAIGIDAEPHAPLPPGVLDAVALPAERAMLARLAEEAPGVHWDRLLFCAKECIYKAWYPIAGRWLDFHDASVELDPGAGTFAARLHVPAPAALDGLAGRWLTSGGLLVAALVVTGR